MRSSVRVTGCRPPRASAAAGQGDIERLGGQTALRAAALRIASRRALSADSTAFLGDVDRRAGGLALLGRQLAQALEQLGERAALAEVARLGLFQRIGVGSGGERRAGFANELIEIVHDFRNKTTFQ